MLRAVIAAYRDAFAGLPAGAWWLALVCFVHRSGTMVLPFLALYLTTERGLTPTGAGVVLSLYGVGAGLGAFLGGLLTDRWGPLRVQVASLALAGLGFLLLGQLERTAAIQAAAFMLALTGEAFRPANTAGFAAHAPPERWTQAFGLRRLAINLGMTCGPALGGLLAAHDYGLLFLVDGGTCLLAAVLLASLDRSPRTAPRAAAAARAGSPWRDRPFVVLLALVAAYGAVLYQFFSTYPLTLRAVHGFSEPQVGSVYAINTVLIVLVEMLIVRRLSGGAPLRIAAWGAVLFCGGIALLPFGGGYLFVAATVVVWTVGEMLTMPFFETTVAARGDQHNRGSYLGAYNFAMAIAYAGAPLLGTAAYERWGPLPLFAAFGAVGLVLWLGLRLLAPHLASRPAVPAQLTRPAALPPAAPPAA
jgi:predicted MFS family arabinose efflux permease